MENQAQLTDLLSEHEGWQKQILYFKSELKSMKDELGIIVAKYSPRDVPASSEHFQNQIILQKDVMDIMRHDFKQFENQVEDAQRLDGNVSDYLLMMRNAYKIRLNDYDKIFHDLKNEFEMFKRQEAIPA
ncbi:MAG: hypothetical protein M3Q95_13485 [Bacteroidota bacterium]|nr:hypothetical protein [Bacteroidota bacterium]